VTTAFAAVLGPSGEEHQFCPTVRAKERRGFNMLDNGLYPQPAPSGIGKDVQALRTRLPYGTSNVLSSNCWEDLHITSKHDNSYFLNKLEARSQPSTSSDSSTYLHTHISPRLASPSAAEAATDAISLLFQPDLLDALTLKVDQDDLFAFALSCKEFRDAWRRTHRKLRTRVRHAASSRELLRWSVRLGLPLDTRTSAYAALSGKVDVLQYCRELGCPWDEKTTAYAAASGNVEVLRWAHGQRCHWDERTCAYAAGSGNLETLCWARQQGAPWDSWTCAEAARANALDVLKWSRQNGAPWDAETCAEAAGANALAVLGWARMNGCP